MRNVPPDADESVSEHVEHFFCVNHPDHYLTHQVFFFVELILIQNILFGDVFSGCLDVCFENDFVV